jgi:hypothetical protein
MDKVQNPVTSAKFLPRSYEFASNMQVRVDMLSYGTTVHHLVFPCIYLSNLASCTDVCV